MKTNLTPEQIERGRAFLKDLRANTLKAKERMRDEHGGRCCLCVAYDTAQRLGAGLPECDKNEEEIEDLPPDEIGQFYGWGRTNPILSLKSAAMLNDAIAPDGKDVYTHPEIADLFEEEFPQLKEA